MINDLKPEIQIVVKHSLPTDIIPVYYQNHIQSVTALSGTCSNLFALSGLAHTTNGRVRWTSSAQTYGLDACLPTQQTRCSTA
jgi:hypothetical protein